MKVYRREESPVLREVEPRVVQPTP